MSNPTANYNFQMPTSTDLVTDLPADFEVFGQAVDTQMKTNADAATQKATLTTKGDIYAATAASTPTRLALGTNGQVLTVDTTTATGLKYADAGGGSMTLLSTTSITTTSTVITGISQAYKNLLIFVSNAYAGTGVNSSVGVRFGDSAILDASNYFFNGTVSTGTATGNHYGSIDLDRINMNNQTATNRYQPSTFILEFPFYTETNTFKMYSWRALTAGSTGNLQLQNGMGAYNVNTNTDKISRIEVLLSNTPISGTIYIYGVK
jgi:hypothetical protein